MSYKPISLANMISLKNHHLFLPHIQRPFVWDWEQVTRFIDSLMKNYPIQTFLFWKTNEEIKARKFMDDIIEDPDLSDYYDKNISEKGKEKTLVLDGQQRLQSLFSTFDGTFYGEDVYINITDGDEVFENGLSYGFKTSNENQDLPFFKMKSLTTDRRNAEDIAEEINEKLSKILPLESTVDKAKRERRVRRNISQLVSILREDKHFWVDELDGTSDASYYYKAILNIFIRVNSGGTKLDAADLMFAAMKEAWADIEQNIENITEVLNKSGKINFDKTFVLKALMISSGKGAALLPENFLDKKGEENLKLLEGYWERSSKAFEQLKDFIYNDLKVYSDKVIRSYNAFIPIFEYFFLNPSPGPEDRELIKSYYYKSQLFNWYSSRTDQILDAMHSILTQSNDEKFPLDAIKNYFKSLYRKVDLTIGDLGENRLRFIILNLIYVNQIGGSPFDVAYKGNEPHIDHIYPKSKLWRFDTCDINHIGNYRFIGATDNLRKRAEEPSSYFQRLKNNGIPIDRHLLVKEYSEDPSILIESNYKDFLDKRIKAIFDICDKVVNR